jgi:hypothetical protein
MSEGAADAKKTLPKGGRKGGKIFPHYNLKDALLWADKLVSKTYTAPQPVEVIRASVIEAKSGVANMRISALRQFGLLKGPSSAISATDLAREIRAAPDEDKLPLLQKAVLQPDVFKKLFETFHGDVKTSVSKIRQRASEIGVHPDTADKCAQVYSDSVVLAGLAKREGDALSHEHAASIADEPEAEQPPAEELGAEDEEKVPGAGDAGESASPAIPPTRGRAAVQVSINLDSSLDTEKLQKQLELLRQYGAL